MTSSTRRTLGNLSIWIGVLAWVPFLSLVAGGQRVSILPFLAVHLAGVLGGAWLRNSADRMDGLDNMGHPHGRRRKLISRIMIYLGVLAWAPFFYIERVLGQDLAVGPFLVAHLAGILGGAALRASVELDRFVQRK
ncbi:MAG: hypothetical protein HY784_16515 [Chloroflexi bacterium]|nr:hypothetical protein [Chloroflexota bacterium]